MIVFYKHLIVGVIYYCSYTSCKLHYGCSTPWVVHSEAPNPSTDAQLLELFILRLPTPVQMLNSLICSSQGIRIIK